MVRALNPTIVCLARVSPPRGACAHSRPQPAQPRSLPHAKCASAAARKGSERELIWLIHFDRMQYLENFIEPRRARELSMQGKEGRAPAKRREPK